MISQSYVIKILIIDTMGEHLKLNLRKMQKEPNFNIDINVK
jgi:hypothetical protein